MATVIDRAPIDTVCGPDGVHRVRNPVDDVTRAIEEGIGVAETVVRGANALRNAGAGIRDRIRNLGRELNPAKRKPRKRRRNPDADVVDGEEC